MNLTILYGIINRGYKKREFTSDSSLESHLNSRAQHLQKQLGIYTMGRQGCTVSKILPAGGHYQISKRSQKGPKGGENKTNYATCK